MITCSQTQRQKFEMNYVKFMFNLKPLESPFFFLAPPDTQCLCVLILYNEGVKCIVRMTPTVKAATFMGNIPGRNQSRVFFKVANVSNISLLGYKITSAN